MSYRRQLPCLAGAALAALATGALAQMPPKPMAYPASGQTSQQQSSDDGTCYAWAKQQTGVDPMTASAPPQAAAPQGQRVKGAAGGAAAGAVVGAATGDAGHGAAVGAAAGTVAGGVAHRQQRRQTAAANSQAQAISSQEMASYNQAWSACMQGKGYSVK
jgi:hypothetical protein